MNKLCQFMLGQHHDHNQRTIEQIWHLDDYWLQYEREYMYWLFPIDTPSQCHPEFPLACQVTRDYFISCRALRQAQLKSLIIMLDFYELHYTGDDIIPKVRFNQEKHSWLTKNDHNHRRITRIIRSLALLGQMEVSVLFQDAMLKAAIEYGDICDTTLNHWRNANRFE
ncbi:hypothetical protein A9264_07060 [Vibrio sp. UCD-FRSSP16_10]|uniref:opioid growth factor receptor-related protein n=1 Tax=unclassified Vibrio TaxID=2614977 RepID=UPI0007FDB2FD|nr:MULTISPECIES: opioid growth factor receptor-related protein [unclassified Vibrio]OBT13420.1 hypothetical protein A9264_07060 [Vibrio sp. UCD-FRSSP16_10]OBT17930.1 hypothetical protein A9260_01050 [Vibrio sp. UCD-FRSSP16_30]